MSLLSRPSRAAAVAAAFAFATTLSACGSDSNAVNTSAQQGTSAQSAPPQGTTPGGRGRGGPGMMNLAAAAKQLGVKEDELQTAMQAAFPNRGAGGQPPQGGSPPNGQAPAEGDRPQVPDMTEMYEAIAKQLDLDADEVKKAFEAARPQGDPPQGEVPSGAAE